MHYNFCYSLAIFQETSLWSITSFWAKNDAKRVKIKLTMRTACLINFTNLWWRNERKRWRNKPKFRQDSHHSAKSKDGRNLRALEHVCIGPIHWYPLLALFARRKLGSISGCLSPTGNTLIWRNSKSSWSIWS